GDLGLPRLLGGVALVEEATGAERDDAEQGGEHEPRALALRDACFGRVRGGRALLLRRDRLTGWGRFRGALAAVWIVGEIELEICAAFRGRRHRDRNRGFLDARGRHLDLDRRRLLGRW